MKEGKSGNSFGCIRLDGMMCGTPQVEQMVV